jgi:hypothetical protein
MKLFLRGLFFLLLIGTDSRFGRAAVSCVVQDSKLLLHDASPASEATTCTYTCIVLRGGTQASVSCKINLNAGQPSECTATAQPGDVIVGAASACGGASLPKSETPVTNAPR